MHVVDLREIGVAQAALVGGKGAHLAELSRIDGLRVPAGFCITTHAFRRVMEELALLDGALDRLAQLKPGDGEEIRSLSAELRATIEAVAFPDDLTEAILRALGRHGAEVSYAIRSSATAEDLP